MAIDPTILDRILKDLEDSVRRDLPRLGMWEDRNADKRRDLDPAGLLRFHWQTTLVDDLAVDAPQTYNPQQWEPPGLPALIARYPKQAKSTWFAELNSDIKRFFENNAKKLVINKSPRRLGHLRGIGVSPIAVWPEPDPPTVDWSQHIRVMSVPSVLIDSTPKVECPFFDEVSRKQREATQQYLEDRTR